MGLADLKKNATQCEQNNGQRQAKQVSLDALINDFINDADHYASGRPEHSRTAAQVIALETGFNGVREPLTLPSSAAVAQRNKNVAPYRKATFTLSESAIAHLAELADGCDMAKSKLIRCLIEHHYSLNDTERRQTEQSMHVD
ncbi:CopG family transcriptional regulator [Shewanella algidipiscicola]|uniref:CopG family transcriptional regulator n=1 Tax=Shewanella algidipiscicola TaxID=614070 RepID=A0ABQ4P8T8_9GAMM|nr:CopG family transcriptional regulator [Shewanella algidipiscicola]GIU43828.1 CopG family transcriptional regulator [Shewanella algidipiscicola]